MEDLRGMPEMDIEGMTKNWKPVAIVVLGLLAVGLLGYFALGIVNAPPVAMAFEEKTVSAGQSTLLKVSVTNTGEIDAKNVTVIIEPESDAITITNAVRVESTIGSKSRRQFDFTVSIAADVTPGTYKITAKAINLLEEEQLTSAYLEVE